MFCMVHYQIDDACICIQMSYMNRSVCKIKVEKSYLYNHSNLKYKRFLEKKNTHWNGYRFAVYFYSQYLWQKTSSWHFKREKKVIIRTYAIDAHFKQTKRKKKQMKYIKGTKYVSARFISKDLKWLLCGNWYIFVSDSDENNEVRHANSEGP